MKLTRLTLLSFLLFPFCILESLPQQVSPPDLRQLLQEHHWSELRETAARTRSKFYQGVAAAVFNEPEAERLLRESILENPSSDEAYEAYDWLSNIYARSGKYHRLEAIMEAKWDAFPNKTGNSSEKFGLAPLRGLPDQENGPRRVSVVRHGAKSLAIPLAINGKPAEFFFDDGFDTSAISVDEAKDLGMTITQTVGTMQSMTDQGASFRMAIAKDVLIGKMQFRNVSFAVFPDNQEPWSLLPKKKRGLLGLPIMVAMGNLAWSSDGTIKIGEKSRALEHNRSNLFFDNGKRPVVAGLFQGIDIWLSLDTGATTTDVYSAFAQKFPEFLAQHGSTSKNEIRGIGGANTFDAVNVPDLPLTINGREVVLRDVAVMTKQSSPRKWICANLGDDLLMQTGYFRIDFEAMTLSLNVR